MHSKTNRWYDCDRHRFSLRRRECIFLSMKKKFPCSFLTQTKRIVFSATNSKTFPILFNKEGYFFFYPKNNNTHFVALYMNIKIVHPLIKL